MSTGDRVVNALIGATLGAAVGGALVAIGGAGGTVFAGTATKVLGLFGATGAQTFAIGALAFDIPTMIMLPFFGMEIEPIEYSE